MNEILSRRTPLSPDYPWCDECYAKLLVYPGEMHPDEVSKMLKLVPTKKNIPGTKITNSLGRTREIKLAGWFLSSENSVHSKDLREHLDWLLDQLTPSAAALKELQQRSGILMGVNCIWRSLSWHGGPVLWPEQMIRMSELNLECSFDVYFVGDDEE